MKTKWLALFLIAGGTLFAGSRVSIGVYFGAPAGYGYVPVAPAPVVVPYYRPPCPGPGYVWIDGYYDPYRTWYPGYWAVPPYAGAYWVAPRYYGGRFTYGYWGGRRGHYRDDGWYRMREYRGHGRAVGHYWKGYRH